MLEGSTQPSEAKHFSAVLKDLTMGSTGKTMTWLFDDW